jgi:hypothetical protein
MQCDACLMEKESVPTPCKSKTLCAECWNHIWNWPPELAVAKCPICLVEMADWHLVHGEQK